MTSEMIQAAMTQGSQGRQQRRRIVIPPPQTSNSTSNIIMHDIT